METNANYTLVGGFIIILVTAIILGIIWLSSGFSVAQLSTYRVYMKESVSGLSPDAPVEYNGVNVGTVKNIAIDAHNPQLVDLLLEIKDQTPITNGTRAKLNSRALTGIAFIALEDKGTDRRPLQSVKGEPYPVIATAPSFFLRLDTALTQLNDSLSKVSTSIASLLDSQNLLALKGTLHNLQDITTSLSANTGHMSNILLNTDKMSRQFAPLMQSSIDAMKIIQSQTVPAANSAMTSLDVVMRNLSQISAEIKQNPAVVIRGKGQQKLGPGEQ